MTRCLLLAGAFQYTSSSSWSAFTSRGGSASPARTPEEEEEAVSLRLVIVEGGVGDGAAAAQHGAARQRERRIRVPGLRGGGRRTDERAQGQAAASATRIRPNLAA